MTEQHAPLNQLNHPPVTETSNWIVGEPAMGDLLGDPVVHAVLRRDGLSLGDLREAIARGRSRLYPAATVGPARARKPEASGAA